MSRAARRPHAALSPMNGVTALAGIFFGIIVGYVLGAGQAQGPIAAAAAADPHVHSTGPTAIVDEGELQAYRNILSTDPGNLKANVELGNRLYDAGRYAEAIPHYNQALRTDPGNVAVSTDLGTALYYAGRTDEALAQLEKSLAIDGRHAQTWFNLGIIRRDGKGNKAGAAEAWERLLEIAPNYPDAARVRTMIAEARQS